MATFKVVVRKKRADGFYPVYIRVVHRSRMGYIKTDKLITDKQITKNGEIKDIVVNEYCSREILRYSDMINRKDVSNYSVAELIEFLIHSDEEICFSDYATKFINRMASEGHERNAKNYRLAVNHLERYLGTTRVMFTHLSSSVLTRWINSLSLTNRAKEMYPTCLRQIFKRALIELNDEERGIVRIKYVKSAGKSSGVFEPSRYEVKPVDTEKIPGLFFRRGLSKATVTALSPFISLIRDKNNVKFEGYNIGFPYTDGKGNEVRGYEIRGHGGYKSKAAGTDSSSSAWVAVPSGISPDNVRSVFFCESAFDAMAFYQMNRIQIGDSAALVSLGGTFSDRQITGVLERFPNARAFDCFDNDLTGRIYGLRMMALQEGIQMKISRTDGGIRIEAKGKVFEPDMERPLLAQVARQLNIRYRMGQWLPPKAFKDWNDCLLNRPMEPVISPHKEEREQNLSEQRNKGRKI